MPDHGRHERVVGTELWKSFLEFFDECLIEIG